jgi:PKD repeat protein
MTRLSWVLVGFFVVFVVVAAPAFAQSGPGRTLSVQGSVYTSAGSPANGTYTLMFRLFTAEAGGTALYEQTHASVTVAAGLFDVELGPVPQGVVEGNPTLWLETSVEGQALPRRPMRPVAWSLAAGQALVSADLACSGCVKASHVGFPWAQASSAGGAALDVDCTGCVASSEIATGAIAAAHIQDGAVTAAKVSFPYAGSSSEGGPASDLACSGCVGSTDLATSIKFGQLEVGGPVYACSDGAPGCSVFVGQAGLTEAASGWLHARATGLRVRNAGDSGFAPLEFGGGVSHGGLSVAGGDLSVAGRVLAGDGSQSAPSLAFAGDTDTGVYRPGSNLLGISAGGATAITVGSGAVKIGAPAGAPHASATLEVSGTTGGFLPPRLTTTQRDAIQSPSAGLLVMNTSNSCLQIYFPSSGWRDLACQCTGAPSSEFTAPSNAAVGVAASFSAAASGVTYAWTFNGASPSTSTAKSPTATWGSTGTYNVTLTVTDAEGCSASTTKSIAVTSCGAIGSNTQTLSYTGGMQTWTVPPGVCTIRIETWGAQGGDPGTGRAGQGGYAKGELAVTGGETLYVYVGGAGSTSAGGWNGGGGHSGSTTEFGGGGGASDVRRGGTSLNQRIIVAGGGGGAGSTCPSAAGTYGGHGGGLTGGNPSGSCNSGSQPTPGTQNGGGSPGGYDCNPYCTAGAFGVGGTAGGSCGCGAVGGGGGGWYGGGGACHCKAAAGGSSYVGGVTNSSTSVGGRTGHGQVTFTW